MPSPLQTATAALLDLGFSRLEAEVYVLLLQEGEATGYRVAQALGKAAAGVYKALDSLERRGAIVSLDAKTRVCRAVPYEEVLERLSQRFESHRDAAADALRRIGTKTDEARVYRLQDFRQVVTRAQAMLGRATGVAVVDLFPRSIPLVTEAVSDARARGVWVIAKLYEDAPLDADHVSVTPHGPGILKVWKRDFLNLVVDGTEHLLSYLDVQREEVIQAAYSNSPYLSVLYYSGITSEVRADMFEAAILRGATKRELHAIVEELRTFTIGTRLPGLVELIATGDDPAR